jgi:hypothetical protein
MVNYQNETDVSVSKSNIMWEYFMHLIKLQPTKVLINGAERSAIIHTFPDPGPCPSIPLEWSNSSKAPNIKYLRLKSHKYEVILGCWHTDSVGDNSSGSALDLRSGL